jgi:hypothetical protein
MSRRNYTREILAAMCDNRVAVVSYLGRIEAVRLEPRSKTDPTPWTDGTFRYSGREVHTVPSCGEKMLHLSSGRFVNCTRPTGHSNACWRASKA